MVARFDAPKVFVHRNRARLRNTRPNLPAIKCFCTHQKKQGTKSQHPRAKATLYGLSSIKRSGDVTVNMMNTHTTVRTNFLLGPLVLKVEKEVRRVSAPTERVE